MAKNKDQKRQHSRGSAEQTKGSAEQEAQSQSRSEGMASGKTERKHRAKKFGHN